MNVHAVITTITSQMYHCHLGLCLVFVCLLVFFDCWGWFFLCLACLEMAWVSKWTTNQVENLQDSVKCLERITILAHSEQTKHRSMLMDVAKKMGSSYNELGKLAMARAELLLRKGEIIVCKFK